MPPKNCIFDDWEKPLNLYKKHPLQLVPDEMRPQVAEVDKGEKHRCQLPKFAQQSPRRPPPPLLPLGGKRLGKEDRVDEGGNLEPKVTYRRIRSCREYMNQFYLTYILNSMSVRIQESVILYTPTSLYHSHLPMRDEYNSTFVQM